ncbi:hypothetical protein HS088_TW02G00806 [Tripterygium wilfordii]|uniref:Uncharacterized protein n=1 Tax=Tripterygium wilfordii TaxID=458696 RepID=A0A7J7DZK6_TRIWF|nr:hypothetical protein HS088_TW02G00806 [Tripterygium wilfordii]
MLGFLMESPSSAVCLAMAPLPRYSMRGTCGHGRVWHTSKTEFVKTGFTEVTCTQFASKSSIGHLHTKSANNHKSIPTNCLKDCFGVICFAGLVSKTQGKLGGIVRYHHQKMEYVAR